jgi:hypothetical protein
MEIKDVTIEDVTNREHKKFQATDPFKDGPNQLQKMHCSGYRSFGISKIS